MSTYQTKRTFCGRPARVGDDVVLAAPKHGTAAKWRIVDRETRRVVGEYIRASRADALEALRIDWIHGAADGALNVKSSAEITAEKYAVYLVEGAVCLRAGKVLAISASRDLPWILDLGDVDAGPSLDWVHSEREVIASTIGDPKLFPIGSWAWVPPRGLLETLEVAEHAFLAAGGWRPAERGGHWLDTDGSTWPTSSALDLARMRCRSSPPTCADDIREVPMVNPTYGGG